MEMQLQREGREYKYITMAIITCPVIDLGWGREIGLIVIFGKKMNFFDVMNDEYVIERKRKVIDLM